MTVWSESHVAPWVAFYHHKSPTYLVLWSKPYRKGDNKFENWHVTPCDPVTIESCSFIWALPHHTSATCQVWWLSLSYDLMWPHGQRDMWLHGCLHFTISYQFGKFCSHKPRQRGYITPLICHINTYNNTVRDSCGCNILCLVVTGLAEE